MKKKEQNTLCWYCKKCCNQNLCSMPTGTIPSCAKVSNGYVVSCANFERDIPAPLQWKDILLLANCNSMRTFWRKYKKNLERLVKYKNFDNADVKKLIKKNIFFKGLLALRDPLNSNDWRYLDKSLLIKLMALNCDKNKVL